jgi:hypothetical protein
MEIIRLSTDHDQCLKLAGNCREYTVKTRGTQWTKRLRREESPPLPSCQENSEQR